MRTSIKLLSFATAFLFFTGCVSCNLDRFYSPLDCGETIPWNAEPTFEHRAGDSLNDSYKMLDDDYIPIGVCVFEGGEFDSHADQIRRIAKKHHAERVLIYTQYDHTDSGTAAIPMTTYNSVPVTSTSHFSGYSTSFVTMPNTMMMPFSYSNRRYVYRILFYRKLLNPGKLGVLFGELSEEESRLVGSREFMKIIYVCRGKAGWKANLFKGDIVLEVNGIRPSMEIIRKAIGEGIVTFKLLRDGKELLIPIKFS